MKLKFFCLFEVRKTRKTYTQKSKKKATNKDEETGQPTKELDGCKKKKKGQPSMRKDGCKKRKKKGSKKDKKVVEKVPKRAEN